MSAPIVERLRKELAHHIAYSDTSDGDLAAEAADTIEALLGALAYIAKTWPDSFAANHAAAAIAKARS